jgi:hypothetical protein
MWGGDENAVWIANALYEMGCNIARGICMDKGRIFCRGRSSRGYLQVVYNGERLVLNVYELKGVFSNVAVVRNDKRYSFAYIMYLVKRKG